MQALEELEAARVRLREQLEALQDGVVQRLDAALDAFWDADQEFREQAAFDHEETNRNIRVVGCYEEWLARVCDVVNVPVPPESTWDETEERSLKALLATVLERVRELAERENS